MSLLTAGTTPPLRPRWKRAVRAPKLDSPAFFASRSRSCSDPVGHQVHTPPCLRQNVRAPGASEEDIAHLLRETDVVAEVHNILRQGVPVERLV